jgi:hypothetical protein
MTVSFGYSSPTENGFCLASFGSCNLNRRYHTLYISLPVKCPLVEVACSQSHIVRHDEFIGEVLTLSDGLNVI